MIARMKKRIKGGFTLIELMIVVAIIGILAAVAIPAFMKYIRKSKTTEGVQGLKKIYEGARTYYMEESVKKGTGDTLAKQFPNGTAAWTPDQGTCCGNPGDKCQPDPQRFNGEPWNSLKFGGSEDPFYFSYSYEGTGEDTDSMFTAGASADLDCDAEYSLYEMYGSVNPTDKTVQGSAGIYKENELE